MKVLKKHVLSDGSTAALMQFSTHNRYRMGLRLVKLRPGLEPEEVYRIDQRSGGIELCGQWEAPWNPNPGPRAGWTKICAKGEAALQKLLA